MSNITTEIQSAPNNDVYKEWLDEWEAWYSAIPPNCDGRPIWEPPIFDYSMWIGEEYEKKRDAMLKYTSGDVARTTDMMDIQTESDLLMEYIYWAEVNAESAVDSESEKFFQGLKREVYRDFGVVGDEWQGNGGHYCDRNEDGTYTVHSLREYLGYSANEQTEFEYSDQVRDRSLSISQSVSSGSDSNPINIASQTLNHTTANYTLISLPKEDDARSWITCSDSGSDADGESGSSSRPSAIRVAQHVDTTPLALRLVSLGSNTATKKPTHEGKKTSEDDDLD